MKVLTIAISKNKTVPIKPVTGISDLARHDIERRLRGRNCVRLACLAGAATQSAGERGDSNAKNGKRQRHRRDELDHGETGRAYIFAVIHGHLVSQ
jgi:hypothetical protein